MKKFNGGWQKLSSAFDFAGSSLFRKMFLKNSNYRDIDRDQRQKSGTVVRAARTA